MVAFVVWMFYVRLCARLGAKRIIGAFDAVLLGILLSFVGLWMVWSSRRFDDEQADRLLADKYKTL